MSALPTSKSSTRRNIWLARGVNTLIALAFLPSAVMKLMEHPMAVQGFAEMAIPTAAIVPIGLVELACLVLYLVPRTAGLGTLLLTGYLGGATMANIVHHTDFLHALAIGLLVWAGAALRIPEFRKLIWTRRPEPQRECREFAADTQPVPAR